MPYLANKLRCPLVKSGWESHMKNHYIYILEPSRLFTIRLGVTYRLEIFGVIQVWQNETSFTISSRTC